MRNDIITEIDMKLNNCKFHLSQALTSSGNSAAWGYEDLQNQKYLLVIEKIIGVLENYLYCLKKGFKGFIDECHIENFLKSIYYVPNIDFKQNIIYTEKYDETLEFKKFRNDTNYEFKVNFSNLQNCDINVKIDFIPETIYNKILKHIRQSDIKTVSVNCVLEYLEFVKDSCPQLEIKDENHIKNCALSINYGYKEACILDVASYQFLKNCGLEYKDFQVLKTCNTKFKLGYTENCLYAFTSGNKYNLCKLKVK